ncbi:hypothetical protein [Rhodoplanes roseus]|uniref:Uncharacterized protein n=1 Tax=Rhodoplanes roseus TaxID=29409 RepID=A0A327L479_9BRAD|nr:hypothetical protein [Rhodoplanes roseus]RAI45391.1 hypothetical protein CH341_04345 [Rhodoplanes roseus]
MRAADRPAAGVPLNGSPAGPGASPNARSIRLAVAGLVTLGLVADKAHAEADHSRATLGVRHWVTAAVAARPATATAATSKLRLRVRIRISDHAIDSRFFGVAGAEWPDLDVAAGGRDTVAWEDQRCHRERGLPKIGVVDIEAQPEHGAGLLLAQVRQRGMRLPSDEIIERKALDGLPPTAALAIDAETKSTGFRLRITLHAAPCPLEIEPAALSSQAR